MKLAIVDYGMGNIHSIIGALNYIGLERIVLTNKIEEIVAADKLLLPGVGNFDTAIRKIKQLRLDDVLLEQVLEYKKPILGICLGMQLLGSSSTESGFNEGLGIIKGEVTEFPRGNQKVPHVGYNQVSACENSRLYRNVREKADFYFTHSFKMLSDANIGQSTCHYGLDFVASFEKDNVAGVQFHPELSQHNGLSLLKNFIELF